MSLEVILTSNVKNLGNEGDQIKVADGYARNFLRLGRIRDSAGSK